MVKITPEVRLQLDGLIRVRQRARTDLWFLMDAILGYKDIERAVHGPIVDLLPVLYGGADAIQSNGTIVYTPDVDFWSLPGDRKRLFLFPRGHLKTSIITVAQTIQWILNYPDVRILITSATTDLGERILLEIKSHFQFNPLFRQAFPDFCPDAKHAGDFGNLEAFTTPARKLRKLKEPTVSVSSVGKTIAGMHYELEVLSDMVDKENVKTPGGLKDVIDHYRYMDPLLERHQVPEGSDLPHHGFVTMEGTRYDFGDLYGTIADEEAIGRAWVKIQPGIRMARYQDWLVLHGDAEADPEHQRSLWPSRFPWKELKKMETNMGPQLYSAQMRNRPVASGSALATLDDLIGIWTPRHILKELLPRLNLHVTVDLASMEGKASGDFSVLTCVGFDGDGRMMVLDIRRGHFTELEVIQQFYELYAMYPQILDFKIEKEARWKTLEPFLRREQAKRGFLPPLIDIPRDNHTSKQSRIRALQPWFKSKLIRFADDLACRVDLLQEITRFPSKNVHDDILDTLADQMQNRDGGISFDVIPDEPTPTIPIQLPENRFIEFDPLTHEAVFLMDRLHPNTDAYAKMTGV